MRRIEFGPVGVRWTFAVAAVAYVLVGVFSITGYAGQAQTVAAGVYSNAQATRGQALYAAQCLPCHGAMMEGVVGPPLAGADFTTAWSGHPVGELVDKIRNTMPQQAPGTLTPAQALDITAYVLQVGKYPAGAAELSAATMTGATFPGTRAAAAAPAGAAGVQLTPVANLAQFMRGVTFPNANIIFNAQIYDPAKDKPKMPIPYDYVLWGRTVYWGWDAADQAALALQETTPLFLLPGRRCQNGRPVPIQNADYQQFTHDLIEFSKELYKTVQARNAEAVSGLAERLNETCANCHKKYRDVGTTEGGGLGTDRCKP